jgi:PII-like signaling protein
MTLLKIYLNNTDKFKGETLWHLILERVRGANLQGATVYKAVAGVGKHKELHTFDLLNLSIDIPIIIELIDKSSKIDSFLEENKKYLQDTFVVKSAVEVVNFQ